MKAACPHCSTDIEVLSSGELTKEFELSPNKQQDLRGQGRLPNPWLRFQNRNVYLRNDIESFLDHEAHVEAERAVQALVKHLPSMPDRVRRQTVRMLKDLE
jgi:hypothetical protein